MVIHRTTFLTTLRLMERPLSRHLVMPWVVRRFATPTLTLYLYYIKTRQRCQVFFDIIFILFHIKGHKKSHGELQAASSVVITLLLHLHFLQEFITSLVEFLPILPVIIIRIKRLIGLNGFPRHDLLGIIVEGFKLMKVVPPPWPDCIEYLCGLRNSSTSL